MMEGGNHEDYANDLIGQISSLTNELKDKEAEIGEREKQVRLDMENELKAQKEAFESTIATLNDELKIKDKEIGNIKDETHTQHKEDKDKINDLLKRIATLETENQKLNNEFNKYKEEHEPTVNELKKKLEEAKNDINKKNEKLEVFENRHPAIQLLEKFTRK